MSHLARNAVALVVLSLLAATGALAVVRSPRPAPAPPRSIPAGDAMTRYRDLAGAALSAFESGDAAGAKAKARELEKAWDGEQKALKSKSPDLWRAVDDAMDAFIKPLMKGGSPDAAAVHAAYDEFIAKLDSVAKA